MVRRTASIFVIVGLLTGTQTAFGASLSDLFGRNKNEDKITQEVQACRTVLDEKVREIQLLSDQNRDTEDTIQGLRDKNSTLMEAYEKVIEEQKTITEQLTRLRRDSQRCEQIQETYENMTQENQAYVQENEVLSQDMNTMKMTLESLKSHIAGLTEENEQLNRLLLEAQEDDAVKMQKMRNKVNSELRSLKRSNESLEKENETLSKLLKEFEKKSTLLQRSNIEVQQQVDQYKNELTAVQKDMNVILDENRYLAEEASEFPKKFTDLARHNRKLVEETAHMHYNMGVSFIKSKDFKRAVNEFKKVLELKPDDAYANYNLGYIYAEHLVDRPTAIKYFRDYLTYAKDANDADWVKKYILTWQTWYGKEKMK